jgi:4-amino-4-deoxy-L-arabinose transferase-like glycosyltransferase
MTFLVAMTAALPDILTTDGVDATIAALSEPEYLLRARSLFVLSFALAVVCVYLTLMVLFERPAVALLGASLVALSWEIGYHARWLAPDGLITGFGALTMLFGVLAVKQPERRRWLILTAVAGGLTVASKYNAALIGVVVLVAAISVWWDRDEGRAHLLRWLAGLALISGVTYLIITPGTLLDTSDFWRDVSYEIEHYGSRGHHNHTVTPGLEHLSLILTYLLGVVFSPVPWIALAFSALIPVGVVRLWRGDRRALWVIGAFVVVYLLYMSSQRVMLVRNLLILVPALAVFSAAGALWLWERLPWRPARAAVPALIALLLAVNAAWGIEATRTVIARDDIDAYAAQTFDYIVDHPDATFCTSWMVNVMLVADRGYTYPGNVVFSPDVDYLIYTAGEMDPLAVQANRPDLTVRWFGPYEVNYNYYPSWIGNDRFVVVEADTAAEHGIRVPQCGIGS